MTDISWKTGRRTAVQSGRLIVASMVLSACIQPASDTSEGDTAPETGVVRAGKQKTDAPNPVSLAPRWAFETSHKIYGNGSELWLDNLAWNLAAEMTENGVRVQDRRDGLGLSIQFSSWGRPNALVEVQPVTPAKEYESCSVQVGAETLGEIGAEPPCGYRVAYHYPGATEWWRSHEGGIQQGWILRERPEGTLPVVLSLDVSGKVEVSDSGEWAWIQSEQGLRLRYSGPRAWDAHGRELPAKIHGSGSQLRVSVDDRGAQWPIQIDPGTTTASWDYEMDFDSSALGFSLDGVGDINGDGYPDVLVAAPQYGDPTINVGVVYLFSGSSSGLSTTPDWEMEGDSAGILFGYGVARAGDVNGDGYGDVIIGAPYFADGESDEGAAYVYLGTSTGLESTPNWWAESNDDDAQFGAAVGGGGDVDNDGYADIVVGAPYDDEPDTSTYNEGRVSVYLGSSVGPSATADWEMQGTDRNGYFGSSVAMDGDLNCDGYADLVVGAPGYDSGHADEGAVYVYYGSASGPSATHDWFVESNEKNSEYGTAVSIVGDVDGDGCDDLVVGAPGYTNGQDQEGAIYLYLGDGSGLSSTADAIMESGVDGALFGSSIDGLGDVDGDGYDDIVIGAPEYEDGESQEGLAVLVYGTATGLAEDWSWNVEGDETGAQFGFDVAGAGDVDGDGYPDILVGAPYHSDGETNEGLAVLYPGGDKDADGDGYSTGDGDCDDDNADVSPDADEVCDDIDNDCDDDIDEDDAIDATTWYLDDDGDGYGVDGDTTAACERPSGYADVAGDCDDTDASSSPGEEEFCDFVDNDCDGDIDEGAVDGLTFYVDGDGDGFGNPDDATTTCDGTEPTGYIADGSDCDDANPDVNPDADEICDEIDNDCDDEIDEDDATDADTWYADVDGDGYGDPDATTTACSEPSGYISDNTDCDDTTATVSPAIPEQCDGIDNDCDDVIDEDDAVDVSTWYTDTDGDGFGDTDSAVVACDQPSGAVEFGDDCDETDASINPGEGELCDGVDNDCDGEVDEDDAVDATTWYADVDGDGFGDASESQTACEAISGVVDNDEDCNDSDADINPDATEVCDGQDNDCDDESDEADASDALTWFEDSDGDGYGDEFSSVAACDQPTGYTSDDTDCNDDEATAYPGATEECDGIDNNCDGAVDEGITEFLTWYIDVDGDGYGEASSTQESCTQPSGYVADDGDCDDADDTISPDATEVCDSIDNDCDGDTDEDDASDALTWFADSDGDGYGDLDSTTSACDEPSGYTSDSTDCDDADPAISPAGTEVCDGADNDCDEEVDEDDASDATTWYLDSDSDGYGDAESSTAACEQPSGYVDDATDCDDSDSTLNPDTIWYLDSDGDGYGDASSTQTICEQPSGYVDNDDDCDDTDSSTIVGATWYPDVDGDGYGDADGGAAFCSDPASGYLEDGSDCDDSDSTINPVADEFCDGVDNDCDGETDEDDAVDVQTWYADIDGDGYGDDDLSQEGCDGPSGAVAIGGDCDDSDVDVNPAAEEFCDGIDNDCDGAIDPDDSVDASTWYADVDGDGFGDAASTTQSCDQPSDYTDDSTDCDDSESTVYPSGTEVCDGLDNDCDDEVDEDVEDATSWYPDVDGDGYGDDDSVIVSCDEPTGYITVSGDCNDSDADINPDAIEVCDGEDNDCDDEIDIDATDATTWYLDNDGDGFGDPDASQLACDSVSGAVSDNTDCDDENATAYPTADEVCDGVDNDCDDEVDESDAIDQSTFYEDNDGDGYGTTASTVVACDAPSGFGASDGDCDDENATISPGAEEICDEIDNDCDGTVDGASATDADSWYTDDDGDGYGTDASEVVDCDQPSDTVSEGGDCDDADAAIHPGADEVCDEVDNDCDDEIDNDAIDATTWYFDVDADGFGGEDSGELSCEEPSGAVSDSSDCDDNDATIYPGADEYCDEVDNDCDDEIDEAGAIGESTFYEDLDGDGFGTTASTVDACDAPSGYGETDTDCDDGDADVSPAADELCDEVDNDCDGVTDEDDAVDASSWYTDDDGDGYGTDDSETVACEGASGSVTEGGDCDDDDADVNPGADETCNSIDDDCDDEIDEDTTDGTTYYLDMDGDGYGDDDMSMVSCEVVSGAVLIGGDCDDEDDTVNPTAGEYCDGVDNDCDDEIDEDDALDTVPLFIDADGDGYGDPSSGDVIYSCDLLSGYSLEATDCDDTDSDISPGADEYCDGIDNDCDTETDEDDAVDAFSWYVDSDGDGFGDDESLVNSCSTLGGYISDGGDCDDDDPDVHPDADEVCDEIDNDCDDEIDEDAVDGTTYYPDADGDGYGDADASLTSCDPVSGAVTDGGDCDDSDAENNPSVEEICDGQDNDCDGEIDEDDALDATSWYEDADGDGYGDTDSEVTACSQPTGYASADGDCDDSDSAYNPGATEDDCDDPNDYNCDGSTGSTDADGDGYTACEDCDDSDADTNPDGVEVCDDVDNDCDGEVDEGVVDAFTWYRDSDGDGYGDPDNTTEDCDFPEGYVADDTDCDDTNGSVSPGADEVCDGADNDCDDEIDEDDAADALTWYADADGDGFGDEESTVVACSPPTDYTDDNSDCDDSSADAYPGGAEICDGLDNDCDGETDEDSALDAASWYLDSDGDGFGSATDSVLGCEAPSGYVSDATDCNDTSDDAFPGGEEVCDDLDNDCDGETDEDDASDTMTWYADSDGDGYGDDDDTVEACNQPSGYTFLGGDCDDDDAIYNPGATEDDCTDPIDYNCDGSVGSVDLDGDGFWACEECDDTDASINPDAVELCDFVDNDCDGSIDGTDALDVVTWYADDDGDGYGDVGISSLSCQELPGYVDNLEDCDDTDADIHPDADEVCDFLDNDCDGDVDNDAIDADTWYSDADGDGYGEDGSGGLNCQQPANTADVDGDCDDDDEDVNPGADEFCDEIDNDCDGETDEADALDAYIWYSDADGDGYGDDDTAEASCEDSEVLTATSGDCDDGDADIYPGADEVCDDVDNDCDGEIDGESAIGFASYYVDSDGDGYGDDDTEVGACEAPSGYVAAGGDCDDSDADYNPGATEDDCSGTEDFNCDGSVGTDDADGDGYTACEDCDDSNADINPGAVEICDFYDNDCDGLSDDDDDSVSDQSTWYVDSDGDGYGNGFSASIEQCLQPTGYAADGSDCDDTVAEINPGELEVCDGLDNDCDGSTDPSSSDDAVTWYADSDGDGYGDEYTTSVACDAPSGFIAVGEDCDDADADVHPDATEVCDGVDNDCDEQADGADAADASTWYADTDGDGFGNPSATEDACDAPSGYVADDQDCDDDDEDVNPDATEVCDGVDNDCNGDSDGEDAEDLHTWYVDADGDGFGDDAESIESCEILSGYAPTGGDCDDTDAAYNPAAVEDDCSDPNDYNCDGSAGTEDADGDGYLACEDCDDSNADINPDADEICDELDNNCDGDLDGSDSIDMTAWFADDDGDGFGDGSNLEAGCTAPEGYVADSTDCDDGDEDTNPDADEVCDTKDNDCDEEIDEEAVDANTWYPDEDADGYGDADAGEITCNPDPDYILDGSDCDDSNSSVQPLATEYCDGIDNDCDEEIDEVGAVDGSLWYPDSDGDGYGDDSSSVEACDAPSGTVDNSEDCDDDDADINPAAAETCDGIDNDCDGDVDGGAAADISTWYIDADGDGYGDDDTAVESCEDLSGYVELGGDCDDADTAYNPGATEDDCTDPNDYNCDGSVGSDDADGDGYAACEECDDSDADVNPGATEVCDEIDNDCDGTIDGEDATDPNTWYVDADGDGFGDSTEDTITQCEPPSGYVVESDDCNDADADINPGADEVCDGLDNDCDGYADPASAIDATTWYPDADEDGYGDEDSGTTSCEAPTGYIADSRDCDDDDEDVNPAAEEECDGVDNDCDGEIDNGEDSSYQVWYADLDGDGYGDDDNTLASCDEPSGYVLTSGDCDDLDDGINPEAAEVCDDVDNDCDGTTDGSSASDAVVWYYDSDGDGYGDDSISTLACEAPSDFVADGGDCDDTDTAFNPGAIEDDCTDASDYNCDGSVGIDDADGDGFIACEDCDDTDADVNEDADEVCDGVDNNCDGVVDGEDAIDLTAWFIDADSDGYGDASDFEIGCEAPSGYVDDSSDCDDANESVNPGADEICDSVDNDCDSDIDEDAVDGTTWYADADSDGYGRSEDSVTTCDELSGYVDVDGDCDDDDADINPLAAEFCDEVDNDCDDEIDESDAEDASAWHPDADGDGYGSAASETISCDAPSGYVIDDSDCDDGNVDIYPGADELCDGEDNDCDGTVDGVDSIGVTTWYEDADGDGYGDESSSFEDCDAPSGYVELAGDCDDTDVAYNPGATEDDCTDPNDYNCDGSTGTVDSDGDGFAACEDCDDSNASVNADADEVCDGLDNDCDGEIDGASAIDIITWYADDDEDGYGDADSTLQSCDQPEEYVLDDTDCDDNDDDTNPGAVEVCDGEDNDCDSIIDPSTSVGALTWYPDEDGDGFGDDALAETSCEGYDGALPEDKVEESGDCDDEDPDVHPDADEVCDGVDNDCDGEIDGEFADGVGEWYADDDEDGYGDVEDMVRSCEAPDEYVADNTDCDDNDDDINPGADERCDEEDNDCDGETDENTAVDATTWYLDLDGDGYGIDVVSTVSCEAPESFVEDSGDCDDGDAAYHPGADEDDCSDPADYNCDGSSGYDDVDGDGFAACEDCNDGDGDINPDADEVCDEQDNDCDGAIDGEEAIDRTAWFLDLDSDGYGDSSVFTSDCDQPYGYVTDSTDCDDYDPFVNPAAEEECDSVDNDCDGDVDEDTGGSATWFADVDSDGFGDAESSVESCEAPSGYVSDDTDCDDGDATIYPDAEEFCDEVDNDCDDDVDESDATDAGLFYPDDDGDGFGSLYTTYTACDAPPGAVEDSSDCDDEDADVYPGADEVCDGVDNDCDGTVDGADAIDQSTWYLDTDGDGYGDDSSTVEDCDEPSGYVSAGGDCDDTDTAFNPGATEDDCDGTIDYNCDGSVGSDDADLDGYLACEDCNDADGSINPDAAEQCDGVDNDCDGSIDGADAVDLTEWYADADGDGFGDEDSVQEACDEPSGYTDNARDCDDGDGSINPGAEEVCDGIDNDCDGTTDPASATGATTWYPDGDEDGFGDSDAGTTSCESPSGHIETAGDCDDGDSAINPDAADVCDGLDNDCDGEVDAGALVSVWYLDADGDGYGDSDTGAESCEQPSNHVAEDGDCDDGDDEVNPGAAELCDSIDNDCDGEIDGETSVDATTWYYDGDGDGFGDDTLTTVACEGPTNFVDVAGDCDDDDTAYYPGATEDDCSDPEDYNCDGSTGYDDLDGDGYAACEDCDDSNASANPDEVEVCDGFDNDCDGTADGDDAADMTAWFLDADGDGYGDSTTFEADCDAPDGYVADSTDCDDADGTVSPGELEICDEIDNDCDGDVDEGTTDSAELFADTDGDGFGDPDNSVFSCDPDLSGYVLDDQDCDDSDATVNPDASEVCDGVDNDCDGSSDGPDSEGLSTWYPDTDGDGYGDPSYSQDACDAPSGAVDNDEDCDDSTASVSPAADEICDGLDNDCDGSVDTGAIDSTIWYTDSDGDGFGDEDTAVESCEDISGAVSVGGDCDDEDTAYYPGATEDDCTDPNDYNCDGYAGSSDNDGDGYDACEECDDGDADVNPGADEVCDGIDNDCDGDTDDASAVDILTWYYDSDGDGYGVTSGSTESCDQPADYVAVDGDCNGADPDINPDAPEVCDGADNDCDSDIDDDDDDLTDAITWYYDSDGDGYGDEDTGTDSCEAPSNTVAEAGDCDDEDADINPDAEEVCDGIDNDCDGEADSGSADGVSTWYADLDGDGYGDPDTAVESCTQPTDYVEDDTDCDDSQDAAYPGAEEICDGIDNDCDGEIDGEFASDLTTYYYDGDEDGFGDDAISTEACAAPSGFVERSGDCDDEDSAYNPGATEDDCTDPNDYNCDGSVGKTDSDGDGYAACEECNDADGSINPDATEVCDDADNDCDGDIDEADAVDASTWYLDDDGDGFGDVSVTAEACDEPDGYTADATDCDDTDDDIHPDADEVCDSVDNDCDGDTDEDDAEDVATWYVDVDGDGYGDEDDAVDACDQPTGYTADDTDCDDGDADVYPGADEICDSEDNDCDGEIDEDGDGTLGTWYLDADGDGYGDEDESTTSCEQPTGYVEEDGDCDDDDPDISPDGEEVCDEIDNDCDGDTDEDDATDADTWYVDFDSDGYGSPDDSVTQCEEVSGYVDNDEDCDDNDATVNPGETEVCDDLDNDCDGEIDGEDAVGASTWYADTDGDGFGDEDSTLDACTAPSGYVSDNTDCDDSTDDANPDEFELCDGIDNDCDGGTDEPDAIDAPTWYDDDDEDGYGDDSSTRNSCTQPAGYTDIGGDCDDTDSAYNPGATEDDCTDPEDYNCDGSVGYDDNDGDGYAACEECDDTDADVNPDATEVCDDVDNDCDGEVDEADATDAVTYYYDDDGDGYGDDDTSVSSCDELSGYVEVGGDCDDSDGRYNPGASESDCTDPEDYNCDGSTGYDDLDGDGYAACDDCDDSDAGINADADETCDGVDNDCDDEIDEDEAIDAITWYIDLDEDGYGDDETTKIDCDQPVLYVADSGDCDDDDDTLSPGVAEECDGIDNDCDDAIDEDFDDTDADGTADCMDDDDDGDGLSDEDEATLGTDPLDTDTDDDGYTDYEEVINGTDPLVPEGSGDTGDTGTGESEDEGTSDGTDGTIDTGDDTGIAGDDGEADGVEDSGDNSAGTTGSAFTDKDEGNCGCASSTRGTGAAGWLAALVLALSVRRRRRAA